MPFKSRAQMKAAFSGGLGAEMKKRATLWAKETPDIKQLPEHVKAKPKRPKIRRKGSAKKELPGWPA
jgi:hypothetical protein